MSEESFGEEAVDARKPWFTEFQVRMNPPPTFEPIAPGEANT